MAWPPRVRIAAVADWDARAASGVVAVIVAVRWEREREYVTTHRDV